MQQRVIPILITLMSLALLGIIFIQYRWIDRAIEEKQELVDNNLYLAVNEVEQQLNDMRAMAFVSDSLFNDLSFDMHQVEIDDYGNIVREEIREVVDNDSSMTMQISVVSTEDSVSWEEDEHEVYSHKFERHIENKLDSVTLVEIEEGLGQLENVLNKIKIEIHSDQDQRLDSSHVATLLNEELAAKGLGKMTNWAIWDNKKAKYVVTPKSINTTDYSIPLFTTDVIDPGRYNLRISLNQKDLIWDEIWPMVLMSALFILLITAVFAYSIKLVIKHKNISQIKSDFINNMTHEFKTPLASITLAADSLTHPNTDLSKETVQKYVDIILEEKSKLNAQVEKILEVAALSKNALNIPLEQVNLAEVIDHAVKKFQLQMEQDQIDLSYSGIQKLEVSANAFHLENVLVNLIENSIKYSEGKPHITIEVDECDTTIKISDQGIGMDQKQFSKVFDNFYRVQSGNLHDTKGFGLGLSYCKLVIEKMNGTISLESELKKGTTAIIQLNKS